MKPFPKIHDRYVGRVVLGYVLAVWLVLVGLDFMLGGGGLMAQLDDLGKGSYGFADAFLYSSYTLPRRLYTLFPTAAVIGALLGLGQLAASSELTALRASGLSRRRLSLSVAFTIALLTGLMTQTSRRPSSIDAPSAMRRPPPKDGPLPTATSIASSCMLVPSRSSVYGIGWNVRSSASVAML